MVTNPKIVFLIVISLATYALAGLVFTVYLITSKSDPALIAVVAGQAGTALGGLLSTLNNTRTQPQPQNPPPVPNGSAIPVQVQQPINPVTGKPESVPVTEIPLANGSKPIDNQPKP